MASANPKSRLFCCAGRRRWFEEEALAGGALQVGALELGDVELAAGGGEGQARPVLLIGRQLQALLCGDQSCFWQRHW